MDTRRLAASFGLHDGSAFGAAHTLFQMGPWRSRNMSPDVRGLYYTGASTTPGTGMPMVVLSGRMTAERILAMHVERFGAAAGARVFAALHGWSGDYRTFAPVYRDLPDNVTFLCAIYRVADSLRLQTCGRPVRSRTKSQAGFDRSGGP